MTDYKRQIFFCAYNKQKNREAEQFFQTIQTPGNTLFSTILFLHLWHQHETLHLAQAYMIYFIYFCLYKNTSSKHLISLRKYVDTRLTNIWLTPISIQCYLLLLFFFAILIEFIESINSSLLRSHCSAL